MKKSLLEIYALAVCFATIVCFVVTLGIVTYDLVQIVNPEFTMNSHDYNRHQSNDAFWKSYDCGYDNKEKEKPRPPEEELTKQRLESYKQAIKSEQRDAFQSLTQSVIVIVINAIFFLVHWRIARRAREATQNT